MTTAIIIPCVKQDTITPRPDSVVIETTGVEIRNV